MIDQLIDLPWYKIGIHSRKVAEAYDHEMKAGHAEKEKEPQVSYREAA